MSIYHKHHILPRHVGGTDEPSNLKQVTIEDHAEEHYQLWLLHGRWQDEIAWKALLGIIPKQEAIREAQSRGGRAPKDPIVQAAKIRQMWQLPGMREHLIAKRKEQSRLGKNPMQGKKHKRVCCLTCRSEVPVNWLSRHLLKCQ